jgi:hypothetical protein
VNGLFAVHWPNLCTGNGQVHAMIRADQHCAND